MSVQPAGVGEGMGHFVVHVPPRPLKLPFALTLRLSFVKNVRTPVVSALYCSLFWLKLTRSTAICNLDAQWRILLHTSFCT